MLLVLWFIGVIAGLAWLTHYAETPGSVGAATNTGAGFRGGNVRLMLFLHPHCPCSSASLKELAWLRERMPMDVACEIYFVRPPATPTGWHESDQWRYARALPRVHVAVDEAGVLANRSGAKTSGHTVLFDSAGQVLFSGGITPRRGHDGDNIGRRKVLALLQETSTEPATHVVFGCPLLSGCEECLKVDES